MRRSFFLALVAVAVQSCGPNPFDLPLHTDVDKARADWLADRPATYTYDVSTNSQSGQFRMRIRVENHVVTVTMNRDTGKPMQDGPSIESIWTDILFWRQRNQLNSASFDGRGLPVSADMGIWEVDSGHSYTITMFRPF